MKKLLYLFLLFPFLAKSQQLVPRAPVSVIVQDANLFTTFNLKIPVYADTTAANLLRFKDSIGLMIFARTPGNVYVRDTSAGTHKWSIITGSGGAVDDVFGRTGHVVATSADYSSFYPLLSGAYNDPTWINTLSASKISMAGNVTAGSTKITLGGTASGASLQNFSIDVNQGNLNLASIGGLLGVTQINATGTPSSSTVLYGDGTWGAAGGGGTGLPNSNVGTGYRWAIPTTNNIKTAFGRGYIVLDSTSNTNGITFFPDTSAGKLATQSQLSTASNGLTKIGLDIQLGGTLSKIDTLIETGTNSIKIIDSGSATALQILPRGTGGGLFVSGASSVTGTVGSFIGTGTGVTLNANNTNATTTSSVLQVSNSSPNNSSISSSASAGAVSVSATSSNGTTAPGVILSQSVSSKNVSPFTAYVTGSSVGDTAYGLKMYWSPAGGANKTNSNIGIASYFNSTTTLNKTGSLIRTIVTDTINSSFTTEFRLGLANAGSDVADKLVLSGSGALQLNGYSSLATSSDSTTYKPLGIDASGNVKKIGSWIGSGLDSGIYVNSTITKTITGTSIGLKVDTSVMATKSYVNNLTDSFTLRTPGTGTGAIPYAFTNAGALVIPKHNFLPPLLVTVQSDSLITHSVDTSNGLTHLATQAYADSVAGSGGFADPLTTNGDIIARISGVTTRLPKGSRNNTFLSTDSSGKLSYQTPFNEVDVRMFGASNDTTVDSRTAFQNAIDYLSGFKGGVLKAPGWYKLSGSIHTNSGAPIYLKGSGGSDRNTTPGFNSDNGYGPTTLFFNSTTDTAIINRANGSVFEDLMIACPNFSGTTTNTGLYLDSANNVRLFRAYIDGFNTNFYKRYGVFMTIDQSSFTNAHTYDIRIKGYTGLDAGDDKITNSYLTNFRGSFNDTLLQYESAGGLQVSHCKFSGGAMPVNVPFLGFSDFHFDNNSVENSTGGGTLINIKVQASVGMFNTQILNNQFSPFSGASPKLVFDATASGASTYNALIDGNIFTGVNTDTAIYIKGNVTSTFVVGPSNVFYHTLAPIISSLNPGVYTTIPNQSITLSEGRRINIDLNTGNNFLIPTLTGNDTVYVYNGGIGNRFLLRAQQGASNYKLVFGNLADPLESSTGFHYLNPVAGSVTNFDCVASGFSGGANIVHISRSYVNGTIPYYYFGMRESGLLYDSANSRLYAPALQLGNLTTLGDMVVSGSSGQLVRVPAAAHAGMTLHSISTGIGVNWQDTTVSGGGGGAGTPGGNSQDIQVKSGSSFYGNDALQWDTTSLIMSLNKNLGANTVGDGVRLMSTGTASLNNQQFSSALKFGGFGWSTTNSASRAADIFMYNTPIQGAANPAASLLVRGQINGGAMATIAEFNSAGTLLVNAATQHNSSNLEVNGIFNVSGAAWFSSTSSSTGMRILNTASNNYIDAEGSGEGFNFRTSAIGLSAMHLDGAHNGAATFGSLTNQAFAQVEAVSTTQAQLSLVNGATHSDFTNNSSGNLTVAPSGGQTTVTGNLNVSGSGSHNLVDVSATGTYSATGTDYTIQFTGTTATLAYPTVNLVNGRHLNIVNYGSGALTIPTTTTGNATTITTLASNGRLQVEYDLTNTKWIQVN